MSTGLCQHFVNEVIDTLFDFRVHSIFRQYVRTVEVYWIDTHKKLANNIVRARILSIVNVFVFAYLKTCM